MNRVHCGPEMSAAYRKLSEFYDNLEIFGFASGSKSGSWIAPPEWIVENATFTDPNGRKIADWSENLLSLYSFSPSYTGLVELETLEEHLFSIPNKPKRIPTDKLDNLVWNNLLDTLENSSLIKERIKRDEVLLNRLQG